MPLKLDLPAWAKSLDKRFLIDIGTRYAVLALFLLFILLPALRKTGILQGRVRDLRNQTAAAAATIAQAENAQGNHTAFTDTIRRREAQFFAKEALPQFLAIISELAQQHGLQMTASKPVRRERSMAFPVPPPAPAPPPAGAIAGAAAKPAAPKIFYTSHEFEVVLTGGYHALGSFMSAFKRHEKLMQVLKIQMNAGNSAREHRMTLLIAVFTLT